jgi:hypothetical protein
MSQQKNLIDTMPKTTVWKERVTCLEERRVRGGGEAVSVSACDSGAPEIICISSDDDSSAASTPNPKPGCAVNLSDVRCEMWGFMYVRLGVRYIIY